MSDPNEINELIDIAKLVHEQTVEPTGIMPQMRERESFLARWSYGLKTGDEVLIRSANGEKSTGVISRVIDQEFDQGTWRYVYVGRKQFSVGQANAPWHAQATAQKYSDWSRPKLYPKEDSWELKFPGA